MKIMGKVATLILLIVLFIGLCVLLYPAISQYWNSRVQSKAVMQYQEKLDILSDEEFSMLLKDSYDYNRDLAALQYPLSEYASLGRYHDLLNLDHTGMIGFISIDKLQIELPIYHGVGVDVLSVACGHLPGTSLPVGGASTHAVLSAHRGLPTAKLFTDLDKMQIGDTFTITILDRVLTYQVDQVVIVNPNDVRELSITENEDYVTLLTCTPYRVNTHRLLVRGKRIETIMSKSYYVTSEAYLIDKLIVTPIVALPILFVLIIYVIFKPAKPKIRFEEEVL